MNAINIYRSIRRYYKDYSVSKNHSIKLFNCQWQSRVVSDHWLYQFIASRKLLDKYPKRSLSIFSVNGEKIAIKLNRSNYKIFYTAENVHVPYSHWQEYEDLLLEDNCIDLSLGFDYIENDKYLRFPLWLMYMFKPTDTYNDIKKTCELMNSAKIISENRKKFCAFLCRNDYFGDRKNFYDQINSIDHIDCDSIFMHNNNDLEEKYNDDKIAYLKNYRFNLCPENSNYKGYVTEKIFEAIYSGCVPIYWGSDNNPEPDILNQNAIIFINNKEINLQPLKQISILHSNMKLYKDFYMQNRLNTNAVEVIQNFFLDLEKKIKYIIN